MYRFQVKAQKAYIIHTLKKKKTQSGYTNVNKVKYSLIMKKLGKCNTQIGTN